MTATLDADVRERGSVPHLSRTTTILRVAATLGWSHLAEKMGLSRFIPQVSVSSAGKDQMEAVRLRLALEQLGPTFVKLGQLPSVQRDLLPAEIIAELEKLQEKATPFPFAEVKQIVQAELGQPIDALFHGLDFRKLLPHKDCGPWLSFISCWCYSLGLLRGRVLRGNPQSAEGTLTTCPRWR